MTLFSLRMPSTRKYVYFLSYFRLNTRNGTTLLLITCGTGKAWGERGVVALRVRLVLAPARLKNAKKKIIIIITPVLQAILLMEVILVFSTLRVTNPRVLNPKRCDESPRNFYMGFSPPLLFRRTVKLLQIIL